MAEASEREADGAGFRADLALRWRRLKGWLFEASLVGATLVGVAALAALFGFVGADALGVAAAEPQWFLLYLGTLVAPLGAFTLYVRRRPAAARVNAAAFGVAVGTLSLGLVAYAVPAALGVGDVALFLLGGTLPPLAVVGYTRRAGKTHLTGPALPVAVLVGLGAAALAHDVVAPILSVVATYLLYAVVVTLPAAAIVGAVAARWRSRRTAAAAVAVVVGGAAAVAVAGLAAGIDPALWVVLWSAFVAPTAVFAGDVVRTRPEGRIGLLGPAILVVGALGGAWLEGTLGVVGLESWLRPTLLLESWSSFRPQEAGIYPQLIGSIVIVGAMAVLAFPVGVGAGIFLEEYAPESGPLGVLATILDVNISNLAGVPSVVYGLLGLALFRQGLGVAPGIVVAAGATLGLLILPIVIVSTQEALRSVPDAYRRGSFGLGASRWQTVRNVVLPEAVPGILTGTILALGRAIGETAPLVMIGVATTKFSPPDGLFAGATALPLQIFAAKGNNIPEYRTGVVAAAALVLLALLLLMNGAAILIRNRYRNTDG